MTIDTIPPLDFLNLTFPWEETPDEPEDGSDPVVRLVIITARAMPGQQRAVVRGEIVASPAYIRAVHGRTIERARLGGLLVEIASAGHRVEIERRDVGCSLGAVISLQASERSTDPETTGRQP